MTVASPVTQVINEATARMANVFNDVTPWYRGSRRPADNKAPPRFVWFPTRDAFEANVNRLADDQNFTSPESPWYARERIELQCWGADYDAVWLMKSRAVQALEGAMDQGRGSWRIISGDYPSTDKSTHTDRGEVYRMIVEFDIPQNQTGAVEIEITPIHMIVENETLSGSIQQDVSQNIYP